SRIRNSFPRRLNSVGSRRFATPYNSSFTQDLRPGLSKCHRFAAPCGLSAPWWRHPWFKLTERVVVTNILLGLLVVLVSILVLIFAWPFILVGIVLLMAVPPWWWL